MNTLNSGDVLIWEQVSKLIEHADPDLSNAVINGRSYRIDNITANANERFEVYTAADCFDLPGHYVGINLLSNAQPANIFLYFKD